MSEMFIGMRYDCRWVL